MKRTAENIAEASGAKATVEIVRQYPVTVNDPALTERMAPTLRRVGGEGGWGVADKATGPRTSASWAGRRPYFFVFLGVTPPDKLQTAAGNHAPGFTIDEAALPVGVRALSDLAVDFLQGSWPARHPRTLRSGDPRTQRRACAIRCDGEGGSSWVLGSPAFGLRPRMTG